MNKTSSVEEYIAGFPPAVKKVLEQVRAVIGKAAPGAKEYIGYGMPAYNLEGPLVYFAAFANHIGFYALPSGHARFKKELSQYRQGKGSVQFPLSQPMPLGLIGRMVKFRAAENLAKAMIKKKSLPVKKSAAKKPIVEKSPAKKSGVKKPSRRKTR